MLLPGIVPLQTARAFAALPAAGAWDTPATLICAQADKAMFSFSYTRGAAGGAFDFQVQISPYSLAALVPAGCQEWVTMTLYEAGLLAAGADANSYIQREYLTYTSTAAAQEGLVYGPMDLGGMVERIRIRVRESGVVGTPGSCGITMSLS